MYINNQDNIDNQNFFSVEQSLLFMKILKLFVNSFFMYYDPKNQYSQLKIWKLIYFDFNTGKKLCELFK